MLFHQILHCVQNDTLQSKSSIFVKIVVFSAVFMVINGSNEYTKQNPLLTIEEVIHGRDTNIQNTQKTFSRR